MDIESIINDYGTEVSILLAGIILLSALICGFLIWKWNKDDKLLDHRGVIEMMPSLVSTLGVFFTFAGIAIGLYYFNSENLTTSIPQLLAGLKTAFFTSLAGMTGSMLLSGQVNKLFDKKTGGVSDSQEAANIIVKELQNISKQNEKYNDTINNVINQWGQKIDTISERLHNLYSNSNELIASKKNDDTKLSNLALLLGNIYHASEKHSDSFETLSFKLSNIISEDGKINEKLTAANINASSIKDKQADIDGKLESLLISIGNMEDSSKELLTETKTQNSRIGEMQDHTEALVSGQDEISKHVSKFGETLHGEIIEIEDKMADTNKLLTEKFNEFADLLKKSNTEALVEVMKKVTEQFQKQMSELINKLVQENFEQLNKSVERLNTWQQENKDMIQSLTSQYKQMAENFENTSTSLSKVDEDTRSLVSEGGKLRQIVNLLNQVIVEDEKFLKISSDLQNTANLTKTNFEQFDASTKSLNEWVKKQRKFVDGVVVLINKLDELNNIRNYGERFWQETRNSMNEGVSIIRNGTETLNNQVSTLNSQFYNRLSTTLTELDNCIQALITRAENGGN